MICGRGESRRIRLCCCEVGKYEEQRVVVVFDENLEQGEKFRYEYVVICCFLANFVGEMVQYWL